MKKILTKITLFLFLSTLISGCSKDDSPSNSSEETAISFKLNGQNVTANVTNAYVNKALSLNKQTLFIEAENEQYKVYIKLIDEYNTVDNSFPKGDYKFENINDLLNYSEFYVYHKINNLAILYHYPENTTYNVNFCDGVANKISATFSAKLNSVDGEDKTVDGVLIPNIITITEGKFNNIKFTVNSF